MKQGIPLRSPDDLPEAVRAARFSLSSAGFEITDRSDVAFTAEKGSVLSTLTFGWLAGKQLLAIQYLDGIVTPDGVGLIEFSRNDFDDMSNEKYLGPSPLAGEFERSLNIVLEGLRDAHLLDR